MNLVKSETTLKGLFNQENVKQKFQELLGKNAPQFITSVLQIAQSNDLLAKADPFSIYSAAATAATLNLPLNNNLGFAYIIPYNVKQKDGTYKTLAQFQIGAKGFKQLALRSGQFAKLNETDVREGEIVHFDRMAGDISFKWIEDHAERSKAKVVGYVSYFRLINGFEQTFYMTVEELEAHGKKYSQTFRKGFGLWKDDFDSMSRKTVVKLNLSKNAPLSIEMQTAIKTDQSVVNDPETEDVEYIDQTTPQQKLGVDRADIDKELDRVKELVETCETVEELVDLRESMKSDKRFAEYEPIILAKMGEVEKNAPVSEKNEAPPKGGSK